jgi:hypothetical protein
MRSLSTDAAPLADLKVAATFQNDSHPMTEEAGSNLPASLLLLPLPH